MVLLPKRNNLFKLSNNNIIPYEFQEEQFRMLRNENGMFGYMVETYEEDEISQEESFQRWSILKDIFKS